MEQDSYHRGKEKKFKIRRMIMNIFIGNLSSDATGEMLREAFEAFGQVTSVKVIKDRYTGQSRGFGFVEMPVESQAQTAIKSLNGKEMMGKRIRVEQAHEAAGQGRTVRQGGRMEDGGRRNRY
jgi:RNA recognition motif-containing protein